MYRFTGGVKGVASLLTEATLVGQHTNAHSLFDQPITEPGYLGMVTTPALFL